MTADTPRSEPLGQGEEAPIALGSLADATSKPACGTNCGCRLRLAEAIADAPPRRHELEVLRLYLTRQQTWAS